MNRISKIFLGVVWVISIISGPITVSAQSVPAVPQPKVLCGPTIEAWVADGYYRPGDCHCDANGRSFLSVNPRMIGDCKNDR